MARHKQRTRDCAVCGEPGKNRFTVAVGKLRFRWWLCKECTAIKLVAVLDHRTVMKHLQGGHFK